MAAVKHCHSSKSSFMLVNPAAVRSLMKLCDALLALAAFLGPVSCLAGVGPSYSYGEAWWNEYEPDAYTALLLHFGPLAQRAR